MKRILYGDDEEQNRSKLEKELILRGYEVDLASNPLEFIVMARNKNYDAIISDLQYTPKGREGYEVLRELRENNAKKILYTAQSGFEFEAEAIELGADYFVPAKDASKLYKFLDALKGGEEK